MTQNNDDNTPPNVDNVVDLFKKKKDTVELVNLSPPPIPQTYTFRLFDGTERTITGFLAAGPSQIMVGDDDGMLMYLVPTESLIEVYKEDITATHPISQTSN